MPTDDHERERIMKSIEDIRDLHDETVAMVQELTTTMDNLSEMASKNYFTNPSKRNIKYYSRFRLAKQEYALFLQEIQLRIKMFKYLTPEGMADCDDTSDEGIVVENTAKFKNRQDVLTTFAKRIEEEAKARNVELKSKKEKPQVDPVTPTKPSAPPNVISPAEVTSNQVFASYDYGIFPKAKSPIITDRNFICEVVRFTDPHKFYVQSIYVKESLQLLTKNIQAYFKKKENRKPLSPSFVNEIGPEAFIGTLWATRIADGGEWHRVMILSFRLNSLTAFVEYVDVGYRTWKSCDSLFVIPEDFAILSATAIPCKLFGVSPINEHWDEDAITFFENATQDQGDGLRIEINDMSIPYEVTLKHDIDDISINYQLVMADYATSNVFIKQSPAKNLAAKDVIPFIMSEALLETKTGSDECCGRNPQENNSTKEEKPVEPVIEPSRAREMVPKYPTLNVCQPKKLNITPTKKIERNLESISSDGDDFIYRIEQAENAMETAFGFKPDNDKKVCVFYASVKGCKFGDDCMFKHIAPSAPGGGLMSAVEELPLDLPLPDPVKIGEVYFVRIKQQFVLGPGWYVTFCCGNIPVAEVSNEDVQLIQSGKSTIYYQKYKDLTDDMEQIYSKMREPPHIAPSCGSLVALQVNGRWRRGRVLGIVEEDKMTATVKLVDTGDVVLANRRRLFNLRSEHTILQPLVREVLIGNADKFVVDENTLNEKIFIVRIEAFEIDMPKLTIIRSSQIVRSSTINKETSAS